MKLFNKDYENEKEFRLTGMHYFEKNFGKVKTMSKATVDVKPNSYDKAAMLVSVGKYPIAWVRDDDKPFVIKLLKQKHECYISIEYQANRGYKAKLIIKY